MHNLSRPHTLLRRWLNSAMALLVVAGLLPAGRLTWANPPAVAQRALMDWRAALVDTAAPRLVPAAAAQVVRSFTAVADAEVRQGQAAQNFGTLPYVGAGYDADDGSLVRRALFNFGLTDLLPPGASILSAALQVDLAGYCYYGNDSNAALQIYRLAGPWSEMGVTWDSQPAIAEGYGEAVVGTQTPGWRSFDATALVQAWVNGTYPEDGLELRGPESSLYGCATRDFFSRGGGLTLAPVLQVSYTLPTPALLAPGSSLTFYHQCGVGAPPPAAKPLTLRSNSAQLTDWAASLNGGAGWLSLSGSAGKVSSIYPDEVLVSVAEAAPCPGIVTAQIQVNASGLGGAYAVDVALVQSQEPVNRILLPLITSSTVGSLAAPAAPAALAAPAAGGRYALVVGVSDYQSLPSPASLSVFRTGAWGDGRDLLYPQSDAWPMLMWLARSGYAVTTLREENATAENINYFFQSVKKKITAQSLTMAGPQAVAPAEVVIYFSGHGGQLFPDQAPLDEADNADEFLAPYDTTLTPFANYLLDDAFSAQLASLGTTRVAVLLDACNSGGMDVHQSNQALLAATLENQVSWESNELEHGIFTYYLLQAAEDPASDTNQDGWLSLGEIQAYAQPLMTQYLNANSLTLQTIDFQPNGTGDLNLIQMP